MESHVVASGLYSRALLRLLFDSLMYDPTPSRSWKEKGKIDKKSYTCTCTTGMDNSDY